MDSPTIDAYNKIAESYEQYNAVSIWTKQLEEFKKRISGKKVLEIGCGFGRDSINFSDYEYVGIDASPKMIESAKKKYPNMDFRLMDFYKLDFSHNSFDGVLAIASLLHIPKKEIKEVIQSIIKLLKSNGVGLITMRKGEGEGWREKSASKRYFAFYQIEEFKKILEESNLAVLDIGETKEPDGTEWMYFFVKK